MVVKSHDGEKCSIHVRGMVRLILNMKSLGNRGNMDKIHNHNYGHLYYKMEKNKKVLRGVPVISLPVSKKSWHDTEPVHPNGQTKNVSLCSANSRFL